MLHALKRAFGTLSILAILGTTLPTVTAQTVPSTVQIIDNAATTGFTKTGTWYTASDSASYAGNYLYALNGASTTKAVWTFTNLTPGQYKVSVTYRPRSYFSKVAEFRVFDGGVSGKDLGATTVNETVRASSGDDANGTPWQTLGQPDGHFAVLMNSLSVTLSANASAQVQADAVRIERVGELTGDEQLRDFAATGSVPSLPSGGEGEGPAVSNIDVFVVYTSDLPSSLGLTQEQTEALIRRSFTCNVSADPTCMVLRDVPISVNGIMRASGVPANFTVVAFSQLPYTSIDSTVDMLYTTYTNERMEQLRRYYNADIVVTVAPNNPNSTYIGLTSKPHFNDKTTVDTVAASTNRNALTAYTHNANFAAHSLVRAVKGDNALLAMTFAHEVAHILGAGHEVQTGETAMEPWSHALNIDGGIKTIDASVAADGNTSAGCAVYGCVLVPLFSNPNLTATVNGRTYTLGVANASDNVRTMTKMAPIVASYSERPLILGLYNAEDCHDTSHDGIVSPMDALRIVNYLNADSPIQEVSLITSLRKIIVNSGYIDTNNDGLITPIDALRVINRLNEPTNPDFAPANACPH